MEEPPHGAERLFCFHVGPPPTTPTTAGQLLVLLGSEYRSAPDLGPAVRLQRHLQSPVHEYRQAGIGAVCLG